MVSNFLAVNHQLKDQINLYVFECGGKSKALDNKQRRIQRRNSLCLALGKTGI